MFYNDHGAVEIETAVKKALWANAGSSEAVKHILINAQDRAPVFGALTTWQTLPPPDVSVYHQIGGGL